MKKSCLLFLPCVLIVIAAGSIAQRAYPSDGGAPNAAVRVEDIAKLIRDCDQKALASFRKKNWVSASDTLYVGLSRAAELGKGLLSHRGSTFNLDTGQAPPLVWLEVFKALDMPDSKEPHSGSSFPTKNYIPAVNNYAYYLRLEGNYKESIPIFEKVLVIDRERIVTNLDLADALWETGQKEKARPLYAKYLRAMQKAKFKNVPPRVPERANH